MKSQRLHAWCLNTTPFAIRFASWFRHSFPIPTPTRKPHSNAHWRPMPRSAVSMPKTNFASVECLLRIHEWKYSHWYERKYCHVFVHNLFDSGLFHDWFVSMWEDHSETSHRWRTWCHIISFSSHPFHGKVIHLSNHRRRHPHRGTNKNSFA